jgi:hypothetical protein
MGTCKITYLDLEVGNTAAAGHLPGSNLERTW